MQERADLLGGYLIDVFPWRHPAYPQGGGPTGAALGKLHQPGVIPASDNGLPVRMTRMMMIVAPVRTGLGIATWPDTGIDRIPSSACLEWLGGHQLF